ncbi:MAG: nuclease-related domain-containing protein [Desulfurella sp.]
MGFFCILKKAWDALFAIELSPKESFGFGAEIILQKILNENYTAFYNRILRSPYNKKHFLEIDAIVYYNNTIFCIEIKNYKGTIYYAANFKGDNFDSYKNGKIIQLKTDRYFKQTFKELPNPLDKTKFFAKQLKEHLERFDARFSTVKFKSVVVWLDSIANIENIYSFDDGLIYLSQLTDFIEKKSQKNKNNTWATEYLEKLPTFDQIITTGNQNIHGIILGNTINCQKPIQDLHLKDIVSIDFTHKFTSCKSKVTVNYKDTRNLEFECEKITINLDKFGTHQKHRLFNIKKIIVGTNILRPL